MKIQLICASLCLIFMACTQNTTTPAEASANDETMAFDPEVGTECSVAYGDITFNRAINGADTLVTVIDGNKLSFRTGAQTDYFSDPEGLSSSSNAPILLTEVDNTKPFTLTAKVTPGFTENGTYNAGVLYIYANDDLWQKFCFEQDERGKHRMVTVRTIGTSDDNNHDVVTQDWAYMRIYSDTRRVAFYYSLDGKEWQMVRIYLNNFPDQIYVGVSNQCPKEDGSTSIFEEITLNSDSINDLRIGI